MTLLDPTSIADRLRRLADRLDPAPAPLTVPEPGEVGEGVRRWYVEHVLDAREQLRASAATSPAHSAILDMQAAPVASMAHDAGLDLGNLSTSIALLLGCEVGIHHGRHALGSLAYLAPDAPAGWTH